MSIPSSTQETQSRSDIQNQPYHSSVPSPKTYNTPSSINNGTGIEGKSYTNGDDGIAPAGSKQPTDASTTILGVDVPQAISHKIDTIFKDVNSDLRDLLKLILLVGIQSQNVSMEVGLKGLEDWAKAYDQKIKCMEDLRDNAYREGMIKSFISAASGAFTIYQAYGINKSVQSGKITEIAAKGKFQQLEAGMKLSDAIGNAVSTYFNYQRQGIEITQAQADRLLALTDKVREQSKGFNQTTQNTIAQMLASIQQLTQATASTEKSIMHV